MHDEGAGCYCDGLVRRAHGAAAGKAEIDFGRVRVAVVGADLPGFPAGDGKVAIGDFAQDLLHMVLGIPLLLALEAENMHAARSPAIQGWRSLAHDNEKWEPMCRRIGHKP
jgi:hypothetical protein